MGYAKKFTNATLVMTLPSGLDVDNGISEVDGRPYWVEIRKVLDSVSAAERNGYTISIKSRTMDLREAQAEMRAGYFAQATAAVVVTAWNLDDDAGQLVPINKTTAEGRLALFESIGRLTVEDVDAIAAKVDESSKEAEKRKQQLAEAKKFSSEISNTTTAPVGPPLLSIVPPMSSPEDSASTPTT